MAKPLVEMETLFKALADATRLRILGLLLTGEVCVCDIHESLKIPQPKASRHLAYLRRTGLVDTRRDGLWIHYRLGTLADPVLAAVVDAVHHGLAHSDAVQRDALRLRKRTGCCVPTPRHREGVPCCISRVPRSVAADAGDSQSSFSARRRNSSGTERTVRTADP